MKRPRNRRGEGELLRDDLIKAAVSVLREVGDESALSLREVARHARVTPPAVYLHFDSKDALIDAVLADRFSALTGEFAEAVARADDDAAALRGGCRAYLAFAERDPASYRLLFEGGISRDRANRDRTDVPGRDAFGALVRGLTRCQENGVIPTDDPHTAATLIWVGLHGIATLRQAHPDFPWPTAEELCDELLERTAGLPRRRASPRDHVTGRARGR